MSEVVLAAAITAGASVICQIIISHRSSSIIAYRVSALESKVSELGSLTERMCLLEERNRRNTDMLNRLDDGIPHMTHFSTPQSHIIT